MSTRIIAFFDNYTKLADLTFLYCFIVKNKINSLKGLSPMGIEPATLGLAPLVFTLSCLDNCANSPLLVRLRLSRS